MEIETSAFDTKQVINQVFIVPGTSDAIRTTDYSALVIQVSNTTGSFNLDILGSNDGIMYDNILATSLKDTTTSLLAVITQNGNYAIPCLTKFIKINVADCTGSLKIVGIGRTSIWWN